MGSKGQLLFGPLAAVILIAGIVLLGQRVPGYSPVHQTVSEIGQMGSPERVPFAIMLFLFAAAILIFASALRRASIDAGSSPGAAYLTGSFAVSMMGVAVFASPHPLHNVFGLSELIGYQSPLALAITWRRAPSGRGVVRFSWIMQILVWLTLAANLTSLASNSTLGMQLWMLEQPLYGLVQRSLFASFCAWLIGTGLLLFVSHPQRVTAEPARSGVS
jgi:hypothetical membrane protein